MLVCVCVKCFPTELSQCVSSTDMEQLTVGRFEVREDVIDEEFSQIDQLVGLSYSMLERKR